MLLVEWIAFYDATFVSVNDGQLILHVWWLSSDLVCGRWTRSCVVFGIGVVLWIVNSVVNKVEE